MAFSRFATYDFAKNALFKIFGVINLLTTTAFLLPDKLSMDKRERAME